MRLFVWFFRALVLLLLFAFALNNRHEATVHGFFGTAWQTPLVIVILAAFAVGCALGVLAMMPTWWRRQRIAERKAASQAVGPGDHAALATAAPGVADTVAPPMTHPPRDGL
jgi:lipopolysaccharide assembly protein A